MSRIEDKKLPDIARDPGAPFIYFDVAPTFGILAGAIQVELASRILVPVGEDTISQLVINGHIRCSPDAARSLANALQMAVAMLEKADAQAGQSFKVDN